MIDLVQRNMHEPCTVCGAALEATLSTGTGGMYASITHTDFIDIYAADEQERNCKEMFCAPYFCVP